MGYRLKNRRAKRSTVALIGLTAVLFAMVMTLGVLARPRTLASRYGARYIIIDLSSGGYSVTPVLAADSDGSEEFRSIISRVKPEAAISGTYFDADYRPIGDIVIDGKVRCRGGQRQAIGFTDSGKILFFERKGRSKIDWSGCVSGIACGPRLVKNGKPDINVTRDGFSKAAATIEARRCAVGSTKDGKLIMCVITSTVTLANAAQVMRELGAVDAINLDGGASCALYADGKVVVDPLTPLNNLLTVRKKRAEKN